MWLVLRADTQRLVSVHMTGPGSTQIVHVIVGLGQGGAEGSLFKMLQHTSFPKTRVVSMISGDQFYTEQIRQLGTPVVELDFRKKPVRSLVRLGRLVRGADSVCCWMYAACVAGWLVTRVTRPRRVVWMIRHSDLSRENNRAHTIAFARLCALLSRFVDLTTFNGELSRARHLKIGFSSKKAQVLDNPCDTDRFRPDVDARARVRTELGFAPESPMLLSVSRWNPLKDVPSFLKALHQVRQQHPNAVGVMCGQGIDATNAELMALAGELDLVVGKDLHLLGPRSDIQALFAACDVFVLHSLSEAFPNTLLEAMASEAACVATDVGDVSRIAHGTEIRVVPPANADALAEAIDWTLQQLSGPDRQGAKNRRAVQERFSLDSIVPQYEQAFVGPSLPR